jgi:hypothetical protein
MKYRKQTNYYHVIAICTKKACDWVRVRAVIWLGGQIHTGTMVLGLSVASTQPRQSLCSDRCMPLSPTPTWHPGGLPHAHTTPHHQQYISQRDKGEKVGKATPGFLWSLSPLLLTFKGRKSSTKFDRTCGEQTEKKGERRRSMLTQGNYHGDPWAGDVVQW